MVKLSGEHKKAKGACRDDSSPSSYKVCSGWWGRRGDGGLPEILVVPQGFRDVDGDGTRRSMN